MRFQTGKGIIRYFCIVFFCITLFSCSSLPEKEPQPLPSEEETAVPEYIETEIPEPIAEKEESPVKNDKAEPPRRLVFSGSHILGNIPYAGRDDEETTLTISMWETGERRKAAEEAIRVYQELNPGITIKAEFIDYPGYWGNISSDAAMGKLSDIIELDRMHLSAFLNRSLLLSEAVPVGLITHVMLCDKALLDNLGIKLDNPFSMQELEEVGKNVYEATGMKTSVPAGLDLLEAVASHRGSDIYAEIAGHDTSSSQSYFSFVQHLNSEDFLSTASNGEFWNRLVSSNEIEDASEAEAIPSAVSEPYAYLAITAASSEAEEAGLFLDWLLTSEKAGRILRYDFGVPLFRDIPPSDSEERLQLELVSSGYGMQRSIPPLGAHEISRSLAAYEAWLREGKMEPDEAAEAFVAEAFLILQKAGGSV